MHSTQYTDTHTHVNSHLNSQLEKETNNLQIAVAKERSVSKSKEKLLQQISKLKQESELAIQAALEQHKVDLLLKQQEQHESILLQSSGLSGLNLISDDYHKGTLHVVISYSCRHPPTTPQYMQIIRVMHNDILDFLLGKR